MSRRIFSIEEKLNSYVTRASIKDIYEAEVVVQECGKIIADLAMPIKSMDGRLKFINKITDFIWDEIKRLEEEKK